MATSAAVKRTEAMLLKVVSARVVEQDEPEVQEKDASTQSDYPPEIWQAALEYEDSLAQLERMQAYVAEKKEKLVDELSKTDGVFNSVKISESGKQYILTQSATAVVDEEKAKPLIAKKGIQTKVYKTIDDPNKLTLGTLDTLKLGDAMREATKALKLKFAKDHNIMHLIKANIFDVDAFLENFSKVEMRQLYKSGVMSVEVNKNIQCRDWKPSNK